MAKKLALLFAAAVSVCAVAVPASASAAPEMTVGGEKATLGTALSAVSTNTVFKTSIGNFTCASWGFNWEVTENTGSKFVGEGYGTGETSTCFFKGSTPFTVDDLTISSVTSTKSGSGTMALTFEMTLPKGLTCHLSGAAVPFTYNPGTSQFHLAGALSPTPEACFINSIEGTYAITSPGGAVVLH